MTQYAYDNAGNLSEITYADGRVVSYTYDFNDRLTKVSDDGEETTYEYDAIGRVTKTVRPDGRKTTYSYDERGNLVTLVNTDSDDKMLSSFIYTYDEQGDYERYTNRLGLEAKNPIGSWSSKEHLVDGSGKLSWAKDPYISTTSDLSVAKGFNQSGSGYGIVKIDINKVTSPSYKGYEIYPRVNGKEGLPYHYSVWQQESSVYQSIPFEAIVDYFN